MSINPKRGEILLAMAEYLRQDESIDLAERKDIKMAISYGDDTISHGYCDTCSYEEAVVRVYVHTWDDETREYVIRQSFGNLISSLDELVSNYAEDVR